jgi:hypothetical protein
MARGARIKIAGDDMGLFLPGRLDLKAAFALKSTSGLTPARLMQGVSELDPEALQAVAWFLTTHRYDEVSQRYVPTGVNCDSSTLNFVFDDFEAEAYDSDEAEAPKSETSPSAESVTSGS